MPSVQVESVKYRHRIADSLQIDGRIGFNQGGTGYQLIVEVKFDGPPAMFAPGSFNSRAMRWASA